MCMTEAAGPSRPARPGDRPRIDPNAGFGHRTGRGEAIGPGGDRGDGPGADPAPPPGADACIGPARDAVALCGPESSAALWQRAFRSRGDRPIPARLAGYARGPDRPPARTAPRSNHSQSGPASRGRARRRRPDGPGCPARERGMATAELAVAMPAVAMVLLLVLSGVSAGVTQLRVTDAARVAARAAAIGEDPAGVASRVGGAVNLSVERGDLTCVSASRPVPGPLGRLGLTARSRACAYTEPSEP